MRHDAPAALPLLTLVCGIAAGPLLVAPRTTVGLLGAVAGLVLLIRCGRRGRCVMAVGAPNPSALTRAAVAVIAAAAGVAVSSHDSARARAELRAFERLDPEEFASIEAPIDHDWAPRDTSWSMRVERFRANGIEFAQPLTIWTRFEPPPIGDSETIAISSFLRRNERGLFSAAVKSPRVLAYRSELPRRSPARWNRALARRLQPLGRDYPVETALVEAVALGRNERLDDSVRATFRRGGTYHLLVFSGLQIAVAAAFLAFLLRWAHAPRASDWLLLGFSLLAPLFIGPTASVSRASVGVGAYAVSRIIGRPTSIANLWCVAAMIRLLIAPADLTDAAFHLTYAGAGSLLFMARHRAWLAPVATELAIAPLTLFHFHQYALGGSIVTVAMTPVVFAMLIVSAITFVFPPAVRLITPLHAACGWLNAAGALTSGFHAAPSGVVLASGGLLALTGIALLAGARRAAAVALALTIPAVAAIFPRATGATEVIALDVGQGDAIVVRAGGRTVLVDGGGRPGAVRFGETTLLPLLAERGIHHLDAVVLTHAHPDHCGGIPAVLDYLDTGPIWITPRRFAGECAASVLAATIRNRTPIHLVRDGDRLALGPIHLTAQLADGPFRKGPENNCSIVLRVQIERRRVLLTGDVERDAEWRLAGRTPHCDVLKVAHHGSRTSSTPEMLDAAAPRVAIISAGRHNLFGHPHPAVVDELNRRRIRIWRTDRDGTIALRLRQDSLFPSTEIDTP